MVRLTRRLWAEFWLLAAGTDAQLIALLQLQPHHLMLLAASLHDREPAAFISSKRGRLWRLYYILLAVCMSWQG